MKSAHPFHRLSQESCSHTAVLRIYQVRNKSSLKVRQSSLRLFMLFLLQQLDDFKEYPIITQLPRVQKKTTVLLSFLDTSFSTEALCQSPPTPAMVVSLACCTIDVIQERHEVKMKMKHVIDKEN